MNRKEKLEQVSEISTALQKTSSSVNTSFDDIFMSLQINKNAFNASLEYLKDVNALEIKKYLRHQKTVEEIDAISRKVLQLQDEWIKHVNARFAQLNNLLDEIQTE